MSSSHLPSLIPKLKQFPTLIVILGLALIYFITARLGLLLAFANTNASPFWPPSGLALAALLLLGNRLWPGIWIGALLANVVGFWSKQTAPPPETIFVVSALMATGNVLEALCGNWLLKKLIQQRSPFRSVQDTFVFFIVALAMCAVSSLIGPVSLCLTGIASWQAFGILTLTWWLGDVSGVILFTPLIWYWSEAMPRYRMSDLHPRLLTLIIVLIVSQMIFGDPAYLPSLKNQPYLLLPLLLWTVFYFGAIEAITALFFVSLMAVWGTIHGFGPFVAPTINESLLSLQAFLGVMSMTLLILSASRSETRTDTNTDDLLFNQKNALIPLWLPLILVISLSFCSILLGLALRSQEEILAHEKIQQELRGLVADIQDQLQTNVQSVEQLKQQWEIHPGEHQQWKKNAEQVFKNLPALHSLRWLDTDTKIYWKYSRSTSKDIRATATQLHTAMNQAKQTQRFALSQSFEIFTGHQGCLVVFPLFSEKGIDNYLIAEFVYQAMFEPVVESRLGKAYQLEIHNQRSTIYQHPIANAVKDAEITSPLKVYGKDWQVTLSPSQVQLTSLVSSLPQMLTLVGQVFAGLVGWALYLSQRLRRQYLARQYHAETVSRVFEASPVPMLMIELTDNDDIRQGGQILSLNQAFSNLLGYRLGDFEDVQNLLDKLYPDPEYAQHILKTVSKKIWTAGPEAINTQLSTSWVTAADGQKHFVERVSSRIENKLIICFQELTERHQMEQDLRQAKETAESANRTKSEFLANMSHEIRTPLNAIIGFNHLLDKSYLNPQQQDYLLKSQQSAESLLSIINDILDVSKIEAGKLELEMLDFNLNDCLAKILSLLKFRAEQKGLKLIFNIEEGVPIRLVGDPLRLEQILLNLISNAIKFTIQGSIEIQISLVSQNQEQSELKFEVKDTGIGLSEDQQIDLFEAFHQADSSITRQFGGTGLGLTIARRLTEMMGGKIGVISQLGQGSCFWFSACFDRSQIQSPGSQTGRQTLYNSEQIQTIPNLSAFRGARILLVEDNLLNQQIAKEILEFEKLQVIVADNGQEAVDYLQKSPDKHRIHLVLMDLQMPIMDGYTAARLIREQWPDLPILALSADSFRGVHDRVVAAGMNALISKPIETKELFKHLMYWLPIHDPENSHSLTEVTQKQSPEAERYYEMIEKLSLPGLQAAPILKQLSNNLNLYLKLLNDFCQNYSSFVADYMNWNQELRLRKLHTLKGLAGTLGMFKLALTAAELEESLKYNHVDIQATLFSELEISLTELLTQLPPTLATLKLDKAPQLIESSDVDPFSLFLEAIERFDPTAQTLLKQLNGLDVTLYSQLEKALANFDFKQARSLALGVRDIWKEKHE